MVFQLVNGFTDGTIGSKGRTNAIGMSLPANAGLVQNARCLGSIAPGAKWRREARQRLKAGKTKEFSPPATAHALLRKQKVE
jgi:hypothetical protein